MSWLAAADAPPLALVGCVTIALLLLFDLGNARWWRMRTQRRFRQPTGERSGSTTRRFGRPPTRWRRRVHRHPGRRVDHDRVAQRSLEAMARAVRAGDSLTSALAGAVEHEPHLARWFGPTVRRCERGQPLARALPPAADANWPTGMVLVHRALLVAARDGVTGGGIQRALLLSAAMAADRQAVRAERMAQSAQARLSATVLTWVPLAFAAMSASADARVRHVLVHTMLGWACLVGGVVLAIGGQLWIRSLVGGPQT